MNDEKNTTRTVPAAALRCVVGEFLLGDNGPDARSAPFSMVARSGDAIDHWYWGKVVHDLSGMRLSKDRIPIDYVHDDKEVIGYANKFSTDDGDLRVSGALVPYHANDRANEIMHKSREGVPYEASINFGGDGILIEDIPAGEGASVNNREFSGPLTVVRQWPLRGVAICPYGADANTSTNFQTDKKTEVAVMARHPKQLTDEITETAEAAEAVEAQPDTDTAAEAVEAVETADVEATPAVAETLARTGQDFLDRFGDRGGVWFAQGKTWDECVELQAAEQAKRIAELEKKLAAVQAGEAEPVSFTPEARPGGKPTDFVSRIRIAGKRYDT